MSIPSKVREALAEQEPVTCTAYYTDGPYSSDACELPADHWPAPHSWEADR